MTIPAWWSPARRRAYLAKLNRDARAAARRKTRQRAYKAAWMRQRRAESPGIWQPRPFTAQPRQGVPAGWEPGLSVVNLRRGWRRLSDWREDAAQDAALRELERRAA